MGEGRVREEERREGDLSLFRGGSRGGHAPPPPPPPPFRIEQAQTVELLRDSSVAVPEMQMLVPRGGAPRNNHKTNRLS